VRTTLDYMPLFGIFRPISRVKHQADGRHPPESRSNLRNQRCHPLPYPSSHSASRMPPVRRAHNCLQMRLLAPRWYNEGRPAEESIESFNITRCTLNRWKLSFTLYGTPTPPSLATRGRPRLLNTDMLIALYEHINSFPNVYLDEIVLRLAVTFQVNATHILVHRALRAAAFTYKKLRKVAQEQNAEAHEAWLVDMQLHYTANQIISVDESSKDSRTIYRQCGCSHAGTRAILEASFKRGCRFSLLSALSLDGPSHSE
jgi:transposase